MLLDILGCTFGFIVVMIGLPAAMRFFQLPLEYEDAARIFSLSVVFLISTGGAGGILRMLDRFDLMAAQTTVAPVVRLEVSCTSPVRFRATVRNLGLSGLPPAIEIGIYQMPDTLLGSVFTTKPLLPGQSEVLEYQADAPTTANFQARVIIDPNNITFNECRPDNNESEVVEPDCVR